MILAARGPRGCPGCDAACSIWDADLRGKATQPNEDDKLVALLSGRGRGAQYALALAAANEALRVVKRSKSWRLTAPLRRLGRAIHRSGRGA